MKNIKFIAVFLVLFSISCKNESDVKNENNVENQKVLNDFFVIKLEVKGKKDETFHVYFTEDKSLNFDEKNTAWAEFTNETSNNNLNFKYNLPKDVLPNQLRLDFGVNNKEGVVINKIEVTYTDKTFNINSADISKYFRPNELCTTFDSKTNLFKPLKQGDNISLFPTENLSVQLEKLFK